MSLSVVDIPSRNGTLIAFPLSSNPMGIILWTFSSQTIKGRPFGKLSGLSMILNRLPHRTHFMFTTSHPESLPASHRVPMTSLKI